jgi:tRNA (guanine-N7-)-methyltransferase
MTENSLQNSDQSSAQKSPKKHSRHIRSFVKREGRLSERIQRVWDDLSSNHVFEVSQIALKIDELVGEGKLYQKLIIEIGSGQGNQIVHAAQTNTDTLFVAFEVYHTGVAHTLLLMRNANVQNVLLVEDDVQNAFTSGVFDNRADEVWTFFPDPWPKKRHHKRRLITEQFYETIQKVLKSPTGVWRIATDWEDYARQIESALKTRPSRRFEGRLITNFEQKAIDAGREIFDFEVL